MLAGEKPFAFFHDVLISGHSIPEEVIPENAFAPYVENTSIVRVARDVNNLRKGGVIRYVCFCLPGQVWRAEFFLWLETEFMAGRIAYSPAHDEIIGKLLRYTDEDISEFLQRKKSVSS